MHYCAPAAPRMSGYLLLGVVRIYSNKVEYVHEECKIVLRNIHKKIPQLEQVSQFQSVTLPESFELDAQNIEDCTW